MMYKQILDIIQCLTAINVWFFEYLNQDVNEDARLDALDTCMKELQTKIKAFKKDIQS